MKKLLFSIVALLPIMAEAQSPSDKTAESDLPFTQSFSFNVNYSFAFGRKENGVDNGLFSVPNIGMDISIGIHKGWGLTLGRRRCSFLSPDTPEDFDAHSFGFLGYDPNKNYNHFASSYALVTYEHYLPVIKEGLPPFGFYLRGGVGFAASRGNDAVFTPHIATGSSGGGMGPFFGSRPPTHDVSWKQNLASGVAAEANANLYIPVSRKSLFWIGGGFWMLPAKLKTLFGADVRVGTTFAIRKLKS